MTRRLPSGWATFRLSKRVTFQRSPRSSEAKVGHFSTVMWVIFGLTNIMHGTATVIAQRHCFPLAAGSQHGENPVQHSLEGDNRATRRSRQLLRRQHLAHAAPRAFGHFPHRWQILAVQLSLILFAAHRLLLSVGFAVLPIAVAAGVPFACPLPRSEVLR